MKYCHDRGMSIKTAMHSSKLSEGVVIENCAQFELKQCKMIVSLLELRMTILIFLLLCVQVNVRWYVLCHVLL